MTKRTTEQQRARALQKARKAAGTPIGYHDALNLVRAAATAAEPATAAEQPAPVEQLLAIAYTRQPTAAEAAADITAEELGVSALPADATAAQRAHAEAVWRPAEADQPCRCTGTCHHGDPCPENEEYADVEGDIPCEGRLVHRDRYPGSMFAVGSWFDEYRCSGCGAPAERLVELPALPWGVLRPIKVGSEDSTSIEVYDGVRHPNFSGDNGDDEEEGEGTFDGYHPEYDLDEDDEDGYGPDVEHDGQGEDFDEGPELDYYRGEDRDPDPEDHLDQDQDQGQDPGQDPGPAAGYSAVAPLDPWHSSADEDLLDPSALDLPSRW